MDTEDDLSPSYSAGKLVDEDEDEEREPLQGACNTMDEEESGGLSQETKVSASNSI